MRRRVIRAPDDERTDWFAGGADPRHPGSRRHPQAGGRPEWRDASLEPTSPGGRRRLRGPCGGFRPGHPPQTEFHFQFGELLNPFSAQEEESFVLTLQQATQWKYGDSFFFIDYLDDRGRDGFNERDSYGEWYPMLSLGKMTGTTAGGGPLADVGFIAGFNAAGDAKVVKYLPGLRLAWKAPGFIFLNTDLMLYLDGSSGVGAGGAPRSDDSYCFDVNWLYLFSVGEQSFQITGHAEYIGAVTNEFGVEYGGTILAQPQFRWQGVRRRRRQAVRRDRVPVLEQQARHGGRRERRPVAAGLAVVGVLPAATSDPR